MCVGNEEVGRKGDGEHSAAAAMLALIDPKAKAQSNPANRARLVRVCVCVYVRVCVCLLGPAATQSQPKMCFRNEPKTKSTAQLF